ncbi:MAG: GNAT family N-acetyltransferase [Pseudomonadota bacterium]
MAGKTSSIPFRIRLADWQADREALAQIRVQVFIREQGVPTELELDGRDDAAVHALAVDEQGKPVGTARLLPEGQVGRMAVLPGYRGQGIGSALLGRLIEEALRQGCGRLFLNAQVQVQGLYRRFGFRPVGDIFMEAGIPHQRMERALPASASSPPRD